MKNLFYFALLFVASLTFSACNNDKNALNGTTWIASYYEETSFVIEFEDDRKVAGFRAENGNIHGNVHYGTYSFSDNNIVFNDFSINWYGPHYFLNGTLSGNYMTVNCLWELYDSKIDKQITFRKQ